MIGNMKIGYARVSTYEQNLDLQTDALEKAGCEQVFHDQISGAKTKRPGGAFLFAVRGCARCLAVGQA